MKPAPRRGRIPMGPPINGGPAEPPVMSAYSVEERRLALLQILLKGLTALHKVHAWEVMAALGHLYGSGHPMWRPIAPFADPPEGAWPLGMRLSLLTAIVAEVAQALDNKISELEDPDHPPITVEDFDGALAAAGALLFYAGADPFGPRPAGPSSPHSTEGCLIHVHDEI